MITAAQVAPFCWIFAKLLYDRMIERAGFNSLVLTALSLIFTLAVSIGGTAAAAAIRELAINSSHLTIILSFVLAILIVYMSLTD